MWLWLSFLFISLVQFVLRFSLFFWLLLRITFLKLQFRAANNPNANSLFDCLQFRLSFYGLSTVPLMYIIFHFIHIKLSVISKINSFAVKVLNVLISLHRCAIYDFNENALTRRILYKAITQLLTAHHQYDWTLNLKCIHQWKKNVSWKTRSKSFHINTVLHEMYNWNLDMKSCDSFFM